MDDNDTDDSWTFFGQYSRAEIDGAAGLLAEAGIVFEVKEGTFDSTSGWSGPFYLWIRDESAARAASLLVPYFEARKPGA